MKEKGESINCQKEYKDGIKEDPRPLEAQLTIDKGEYDYDISGFDVDEH